MIMRAVLLCGAVLGLWVPGVAQAQEVVLEPSSKWQLDYADEKCRMGRTFGEGDARTVFLFEQFAPGSSFSWTVAGSAVKALRRGRDMDVQFGPGFASFPVSQSDSMTFGDFGEAVVANGYEPPNGIVITSARVRESVRKANAGTPTGAATPPNQPAQRVLDPQHGRKIDHFVLGQKGQPRTLLRLGNMEAAFKAMNDCMDNLAHSWGLDPLTLRTQVTNVTWLNQREITRAIIAYYPSAALTSGKQANFSLRIIVAEDGSVANCILTEQTTAEGFRDTVCPLITRRGKFEPARDAAGKGVKSFYTARIVYRIS